MLGGMSVCKSKGKVDRQVPFNPVTGKGLSRWQRRSTQAQLNRENVRPGVDRESLPQQQKATAFGRG
jgi:hypothetical protein